LVGEPVGGRRAVRSEETPSTVQGCGAVRRGARASATDRNVTSPRSCDSRSGSRTRGRRVETADPQGERANRRRSLLQGARVARIAECRHEQKVGYTRHTDHPFLRVHSGVEGDVVVVAASPRGAFLSYMFQEILPA